VNHWGTSAEAENTNLTKLAKLSLRRGGIRDKKAVRQKYERKAKEHKQCPTQTARDKNCYQKAARPAFSNGTFTGCKQGHKPPHLPGDERPGDLEKKRRGTKKAFHGRGSTQQKSRPRPARRTLYPAK